MLNPVLMRLLQAQSPEFFKRSQPLDPELEQRRNFALPTNQPPPVPTAQNPQATPYAMGGAPVQHRLDYMDQQGMAMDRNIAATPPPAPKEEQGYFQKLLNDPTRMALLRYGTGVLGGQQPGAAMDSAMKTRAGIMSPGDPFTLGEGQSRYSPTGELIVKGPSGHPLSGLTKLDQKDYTAESWRAAMRPGGTVDRSKLVPYRKEGSGRVPKSDLVNGHVIVSDGQGGYTAKKVINLPEGVEGKEVKRSDILDDGSAVLVFKDGSTGVRDRDGNVVTGKDRLAVLQGALDFTLRKTRLAAGEKEAGSSAIKQSVEFFKQVSGIESQIGLYDDALAQLPEAGTGPIISLFPTIRDASVQLENIQSQLGLNVIQRTTFGSLSEAELQFALSSALPTKLDEASLADWLNRKKTAQQKLANYIQNAAVYLGTPGNTIAGWVSIQKKAQKERTGDGKTLTGAQKKRLEDLRRKQGK